MLEQHDIDRMLCLAADCHRRKWQYEISNPDAFGELHRMGKEIIAAAYPNGTTIAEPSG